MNAKFWTARKKGLYAAAMVEAWAAHGAKPNVHMEEIAKNLDYWTTVQVEAEQEMGAAEAEDEDTTTA